MFGIIVFIIFLSLLFLLTTVISKNKNEQDLSYRNSCVKNEDCEKVGCNGQDTCLGATCVYDKDYAKNVCIPPGDQVCKLSDTDNISGFSRNWEELGLTYCQTDSDCDKCINQPQWGCFKDWPTNDPGHIPIKIKPQKLDNGKCENDEQPDSNNLCTISPPADSVGNDLKGGYCMPKVTDYHGDNSECNLSTSDIFLTQADGYSSNWSCICKNPEMFDHENSAQSNCVYEKICGYNSDPKLSKGALYMKNEIEQVCTSQNDCAGDNQKCCIDDDNYQGKVCLDEGEVTEDSDKNYVCHTRWDKENLHDWVSDGKCACEPGYTYVHTEGNEYSAKKICINDTCYDKDSKEGVTLPWRNADDKMCNCPTTKPVRCPQDIDVNTHPAVINSCSLFPYCLDNPCGPNGKWDGKDCVCDEGFEKIQAKWSISGTTCIYPCKNNGPCGEGDEKRGTCYFDAVTNRTSCKECICPYVNPCNLENKQNCEDNNQCRWDDTEEGEFKCVLREETINDNENSNLCQEIIMQKTRFGGKCAGKDAVWETKCCGDPNSENPHTTEGKCYYNWKTTYVVDNSGSRYIASGTCK